MYMKRIVAQQRFDAHASRDPLVATFIHPEPGIFLWCNGMTIWGRIPVGEQWEARGVVDRLDDTWIVAIPCDYACDVMSKVFAQETATATLRG